MGALTLAAAQTVPAPGDVESNLAQHLRLARAAAQEGARVVVFPELSLTGYEPELADELAFSEEDERLAPLAEAAAEGGATLVVGAPVRLAGGLHIAAFVLGADRSRELYTKRHLGAFSPDANPGGPVPPPEPSVFRPGDRDPLIALDGHAAALAICADTGRATHPARAAGRGATLYLASMFVIPADLEAESERFATYAARHSMAVVMADFGGPTGGLPAAGQSSIWSPRGELLVRLDERGPGLALASEHETGWRARALKL
jgi:predicted amidohydrolase